MELFQSSREIWAKLSRMDAETEKIRSEIEKDKAETSQTDTNPEIKRRKERRAKSGLFEALPQFCSL